MADGSVIIETKIDTGGITKGVKDIKKQLEKAADQAGTVAGKIENELNSVDAKTAGQKIADDINDALKKVDTDDLAEDISDPIAEGFGDAEKASSKSSKEIEDDLEKIGKQSQETGDEIGNGLADAFKKVGAVIAAALAVDQIVEFGKQCIELGSDLQEVQNVVDVTFTTMSDKVNEFARNAASSAGLSETMAKRYVGTFGAMADSFGFTEQEAYEMSTALTQLSGDVASFYNITQDEAMNKLKGVFTGETEALKELGVVMTQTALDAYAMEKGFGKVTSKMTEQEKVALRYQFVMDQLSSASGDFVRTQDSWANQTRVLSLQWESLMAVLGSGLIDALTPAIQFINVTVMPALMTLAEGFADLMEASASTELSRNMDSFKQSLEGIDQTFNETSKEIETAALMGEYYVNRLTELEAAGLDTAESQREYANIVQRLNELYPELNLQIDEQTGLINMSTDAILSEIEAMKQKALFAATEEKYTEILRVQAEAILAVQEAEYALVGVQAERDAIANQLTEATGREADELVRLYKNQLNTTTGYGIMSNAAVGLTSAQMDLLEQYIDLETEQANLSSGIAASNEVITQQDAKLDELNGALSTMASNTGMVAAGQDNVALSSQNAQAAVESAAAGIESETGAAEESIDSLGAEMEESFSTAASTMEESFAGTADYFDANVTTPISSGFEDIRATALQAWADIESETCAAWDRMVDKVNESIDTMQSKINSLQGKTVSVGTTSAASLTSASGVAPATAAAVPYLAKGAVIPPNAPFFAVLGDQRNGTNLEAPETLIRQIMQEELAAALSNIQPSEFVFKFDGDLAQFVRQLKPYVEAENQRVGNNLATKVVTEW